MSGIVQGQAQIVHSASTLTISDVAVIAFNENPPAQAKIKAAEAPGGRVTKSNFKTSQLGTQARYGALALHVLLSHPDTKFERVSSDIQRFSGITSF